MAVVVVSAERAKSLRQKPAIIRAASQSALRGQINLTSYYRDNIAAYDEVAFSARQLYDMARLTPDDMRMAIIYDHFAPTILPSLEGLGFWARGEAKDSIKGGTIGNVIVTSGSAVPTSGLILGIA